jgi:hypothetical protein
VRLFAAQKLLLITAIADGLPAFEALEGIKGTPRQPIQGGSEGFS